MKIFLDPLDREKAEEKLEAMANIFNKLTTQKIEIAFAKPTSFQKKVLEQKQKQ